jgi:hypothetical protein
MNATFDWGVMQLNEKWLSNEGPYPGCCSISNWNNVAWNWKSNIAGAKAYFAHLELHFNN